MGGTEYKQIVEENIDMIYRIALSHTKTPADADDVVQQTFMKSRTILWMNQSQMDILRRKSSRCLSVKRARYIW